MVIAERASKGESFDSAFVFLVFSFLGFSSLKTIQALFCLVSLKKNKKTQTQYEEMRSLVERTQFDQKEKTKNTPIIN